MHRYIQLYATKHKQTNFSKCWHWNSSKPDSTATTQWRPTLCEWLCELQRRLWADLSPTWPQIWMPSPGGLPGEPPLWRSLASSWGCLQTEPKRAIILNSEFWESSSSEVCHLHDVRGQSVIWHQNNAAFEPSASHVCEHIKVWAIWCFLFLCCRVPLCQSRYWSLLCWKYRREGGFPCFFVFVFF